MSKNNLVLVSTVKPLSPDGKTGGVVEVSFKSEPLPPLKSDEVLVQVEATPINPSDLFALLAWGDIKSLKTGKDSAGYPTAKLDIRAEVMGKLKARWNIPTPLGNEGAGTVIATGDSKQAISLLKKKVAFWSGVTYAQYNILKATEVVELLPGTSASEGCSFFINPLTVIGMIETAKKEGFKAIIHTAAASQLGQMLVKACEKENIPLVNIVRKQEQVALLKKLGAKYVVDSSASSFETDLEEAIAATNAYVAFDAVGGGPLTNQILEAMERVASRGKPYSRYGTNVLKKVYIYGKLDSRDTTVSGNIGWVWELSGWLIVPHYLAKLSPEETKQVHTRVAKEIKTTFATTYGEEISLLETLDPEILQKYALQSTGAKFLINPSKGLTTGQ